MRGKKTVRSKPDWILQDNANILSRFGWSSSYSYKKAMVAVFVFLIFLFLFREPIIKWISALPEPPTIELGRCEADGDLKVDHVHITPSTSSEGIMISFSTNVKTNNMISVQYGTTDELGYEAFASQQKLDDEASSYPYIYNAYILVLSPGHIYYYRISCGSVNTGTYNFTAWKTSNDWKPHIGIIGGRFSPSLTHKLTHVESPLSLIIDNGIAESYNDDYSSSIKDIAVHVPFLLTPYGLQQTRVNQHRNYRFPLPKAGWPVEKLTYHTVLGPAIIIGLNSFSEDDQILIRSVEYELTTAKRLRSAIPWLILVSHDMKFCSNSGADTCRQFHKLLLEYEVDVLIQAGSIASLFASEHSKKKIDPNSGLSFKNASDLCEKESRKCNNYDLLDLKFEQPDTLCIDVYQQSDTDQILNVKQFCYFKTVSMERFRSSDVHGETVISYDKTAWLSMVIILALMILLGLVFHRYLYSKVCIFMESGDGAPLYHGKLYPV